MATTLGITGLLPRFTGRISSVTDVANAKPAPDVFLQRPREITKKHGILLVVDEVQSGMGRTGRMFAVEFLSRTLSIHGCN